ncbi:MAG: (2Fe-2S)-binding protein [Calditrichaeota bacterium]|nr:(2Fe-2S)-binding protein [Calditrichota bacterium]
MIKPTIFCDKLNKSVELDQGKSLIQLLREHDIPIASSCLGDGVCKWCKVQILAGEEFVSKKTESEERARLKENERLLCQITLSGDIIIGTTYW